MDIEWLWVRVLPIFYGSGASLFTLDSDYGAEGTYEVPKSHSEIGKSAFEQKTGFK